MKESIEIIEKTTNVLIQIDNEIQLPNFCFRYCVKRESRREEGGATEKSKYLGGRVFGEVFPGRNLNGNARRECC